MLTYHVWYIDFRGERWLVKVADTLAEAARYVNTHPNMGLIIESTPR